MMKTRFHRLEMCAMLGLVLPGLGRAAQNQTLSVDGVRPLDAAIEQLRHRYGWLINYQDPPIEHPDDMEPRRPAVPGGPQNPSRTPRHRSITITYPAPTTGSPGERRKIIDGIVESFNAAGAGHFRVYHQWMFSHVVPVSVKRDSGEVANLTSLCDATVSLSPAQRSIGETVTEILSKLSQRTQVKATIGMVPPNLFLGHQYLTEAQNQNACDVLTLVMENENGNRSAASLPPLHVAWSMLYDIETKTYFFNVVPVQVPTAVAPNLRLNPLPNHVER